MRGGGRQPQVPGQKVPGNGSAKTRQRECLAALDHVRVNNAAAHGLGHMSADKGAEEIEQGRHHHRYSRRQDLSGNNGGNGIGRVVRAVGEIEDQGHDNDHHQKDGNLKHS
jgi:hypothetical protein